MVFCGGATISTLAPLSRGRTGAGCGSAAGKPMVKQKLAPAPGALSTVMRPPMRSTMRCEMASPSPVPPCRRVAPPSACSNSWKMRACASGAIPMPVSRTRNVTVSGALPGSTVTETPPVSVNFTALPARFISTWRNRAPSPTTSAGSRSSTKDAISISLAWARGASNSTASSISVASRNGRASRSSLPASILEKSKISPISDSKVSPEVFTALT